MNTAKHKTHFSHLNLTSWFLEMWLWPLGPLTQNESCSHKWMFLLSFIVLKEVVQTKLCSYQKEAEGSEERSRETGERISERTDGVELPPCHRHDRIFIEQTANFTINSAVRFHVGSVSVCRYDNPRHVDDIEEKFDVLSLFNIPHPRPIDWSFLSRLRARSVVKCRLLGKRKRWLEFFGVSDCVWIISRVCCKIRMEWGNYKYRKSLYTCTFSFACSFFSSFFFSPWPWNLFGKIEQIIVTDFQLHERCR